MRLFRHLHDHPHTERRFARHEHGHRFSRGGRLARFLEHGDLRLLILHLISEKPRHGYEIIKAIEELAGGAYAPSPGVVYPTLTLLEELGQVESTAEGARKSYSITQAGAEALAANQAEVDILLGKIKAAQPEHDATPIFRAMENLANVLRMKVRARASSPEVVGKITEILDTIARKIEEL